MNRTVPHDVFLAGPHPWPFPVAEAPLVPGDTGAASIGNLRGRRAERELEAAGDGHRFRGGAVGGRGVLRRPARCLLHEARVAGLAALAVVRGVAGVRDPAAGAGAWS